MKKFAIIAASAAFLALAACGQSPAADKVEADAANTAGTLENQADNLMEGADNATGASANMMENQAGALENQAENVVENADNVADNMASGNMSTNTATTNTTNAM